MPVTLQQIANAAGVSRATVDRALKNRGRINPEVAEKIKRLAEEMGYVPNISGRALAFAKRNIQIGVILQFAETAFVQDIARGIEQAKAQVEQFGCSLTVMRIYGTDIKRVISYMEEMRINHVSAIALIPIDDEDLRQEIHKCSSEGIKIVTFNSDIDNTERLCFVGQDAIKSGRTAAGILGDIVGREGHVAMISGTNSAIHKKREIGFSEIIHKYYKKIELVGISHTGNRESVAANQAEELLIRYPDLKGIYISTEGTEEIIKVLEERRLNRKIKVVVQDMTGWKSKSLIDGTIDYVIADDANIQGYEPIMTLFNYLYHDKAPEKEFVYTEIRIVSRYNI